MDLLPLLSENLYVRNYYQFRDSLISPIEAPVVPYHDLIFKLDNQLAVFAVNMNVCRPVIVGVYRKSETTLSKNCRHFILT
jgi:hypothetical protein